MLTINAIAMTAYFHIGYLFIRPLPCPLPWRGRRLLCVLDRALGQQRGHRLLLDLNGGVRRDFKAYVVIADLLDPAEDAHGDDLVALGKGVDHRAVLLRLLHLRTDHEE